MPLWTVVPTRFLCPWNSPGKNTGVGRHSLLQGIFPIQEANLSFPHCRQILHHLSHQGSPSSHKPTQRRASQQQTGPSPTRSREAGERQPEPKGVISVPEMASSTKLRAGSQLLTKSSWDPRCLTSNRRVAARDQLPRGDTWRT